MSSTPSSRNTPRLVLTGGWKVWAPILSFPHRPGLYGLQCFRQHADVFDSFHVRPVCTTWRGEHEKLLVWIWVLNPEWEGEKYIHRSTITQRRTLKLGQHVGVSVFWVYEGLRNLGLILDRRL